MKVLFVGSPDFPKYNERWQRRLTILQQDHPGTKIYIVGDPAEADRIYSWWDGYDKNVAGTIKQGVEDGKIVEIYDLDNAPAGHLVELIP